ncbi:helix-turn-helix domain-containing protein [Lichenibacterium dinghuense]|uniref:helix-turn-helix domain-containing protein n=1 Tax=Lichenibacterium dinghuense TaxID=2895977 RepID=UPI001F2EF4A0|nr:hypothetical protein [Lichenibacterium sp. 6Y81]
MNADEYRATLAALGLSQQASAQLLGVDSRTAQRWALAERNVPRPAARFLRYLVRVGADPAKVQAMLDQDETAATRGGTASE